MKAYRFLIHIFNFFSDKRLTANLITLKTVPGTDQYLAMRIKVQTQGQKASP